MRSEQFLEQLDKQRAAETFFKNIAECAYYSGTMTTLINESTGATTYQLNEAGVKDFLAKGKEMYLDALRSGAIKADELKDKIVNKLSPDQEKQAKSMASKLAKPALAFLLIGGAMLGGMDPAMASDMVGGQELITSILGSAQDSGLDMSKFMDAARSAQVDGMGIQDYAAKVEQLAANADHFHKEEIVKQGTQKILDAILQTGQPADAQVASAGSPEAFGPGSGANITDKGREIMQKAFQDAIKNL